MADHDPAMWSAARQAAAIRTKQLSSRELLDACLQRIGALNGAVNAVVTLDEERGRAAAAAADAATARGESWGPLHGLPITVKDALEVAGMRSTGGAVVLADHVSARDADAVANVVGAGAYCFGKTNVPEWSGDVQTFNDVFGTTSNPWDLDKVPGGSSGGPAVAVALGFTSFEIGTDIGGSIRIPAAYCGIAGHKPSYGLVPCGGYLDHAEGGLTEPDVNVHGPLARDVDDLDLLLATLAGPTPDRAVAWNVSLPAPRHDRTDQMRVAMWSDDAACPVAGEVRAAVEHAGALLTAAGARVDPAARPAIDPNRAAILGQALVGAAVSPAFDGEAFAAAVAAAAASGARRIEDDVAPRHRTWLEADRERARIRLAWRDFFRHHDVLLCPVTVLPPFAHQHEGEFMTRRIDVDGVDRPYRDLIWWTVLTGMAYLPSTVVPVGRTADGLPLGVQVVGPYLEDRTAIAVARALSEGAGGITSPPVAHLDDVRP